MKLSQLRHFQAVCKHSNVTRAAAELHISQPSVSSSIKELESEFGVNLFQRVNKRLVLTQEGTFFLEKVDEILRQVDLLSQQMLDLGQAKNHIRLGVPPMIGTFLFPSIFTAFRERYPEIEMEILEFGSLQTRALVENDTLDAALVITDDKTSEEFFSEPILSTEYVFCVRPQHPLPGRENIGMEDLQDEPLILFKSDSLQNALIKKRFSDLGMEPKVLLYSSQLYTIQKFLACRNAGAFLFEEIAAMEPHLRGIPLRDPIRVEIALIWKRHKHIYSDVSKLISFVKDYRHGG